MRRVVAAGASDVGRVRKGNEDALLMCENVFAVADGMGGHLAGEVASATALEPLSGLGGRIFADAPSAREALRAAVIAANDTVSDLARTEPSYRGMGTTLTAALVEGRRLHVAHVGDSRAYLLRHGRFSQLTDDHTLVQHLVNEGQITREEAASHPQRSMITRAIGISPEVEVDSMTVDLEPGDQLLLCSDGLTGVVKDEVIADELDAGNDAQETVDRLVELANRAGGPDNVTAVLLRYEEPGEDGLDGHDTITLRRHGEPSPDGEWARRLGSYRADPPRGEDDGTSPTQEAAARGGHRLLTRAGAVTLAVVVLAALGFGAAAFLLSQSYYVGLRDREVVIYQGIGTEIGPIALSRVVERSGITLDEVPEYFRPSLRAGLPAADLEDARRHVSSVPRRPTDPLVMGPGPAIVGGGGGSAPEDPGADGPGQEAPANDNGANL